MNIQIAPSILSADFACLGQEARRMELAGADLLHIDVMDGHFVPNITIGAPVVYCLRKVTKLPFDVHLMISEPDRYVDAFVDAGANMVTVHAECPSADKALKQLRHRGVKCALSVKPGTPVDAVYPYLDKLDMVLIMTVEPGFGGQSFMTDMLPKIRTLRQWADQFGLPLDIQVDGGVDVNTAPLAIAAGANILVAGTAVFYSDDPKATIRKLRSGRA